MLCVQRNDMRRKPVEIKQERDRSVHFSVSAHEGALYSVYLASFGKSIWVLWRENCGGTVRSLTLPPQ